MNEVNAIVTSEEGKTPPAACCSDAKRPDDKPLDSSASPLPGRRCPCCGTEMELRPDGYLCAHIACCYLGTGERSGPGNSELSR